MNTAATFKFTPSKIRANPRLITKKQTETGLKDFRALAENIPDIICRFNRQFKLLYVNPAIEKATDIPAGRFINKNPLSVGMPKEFVDYWNKHVQAVFATGKTTTLEFSFPSPVGEKFYQSLVVPEFNKNGKVETVLSISRDITEMKKAEKQKDEFVGLVSHELKTPLTILKAFTQLLDKRIAKNKANKKETYFIKNIVDQTDRLTELINDLLDVGRITAGKLKFQKSTFDLMALLKKVAINFQYSVDSHSVILEGNITDKIFGDKDRIEQVLVNLIANGVKYSPQANKIILKVESDKKTAKVSVQDFGFGISPKDQKRLFERYFRTKDSMEKGVTGFGLGLYLAKEIIQRHKGKIWTDSISGKGTIFYFTLPLAKKE